MSKSVNGWLNDSLSVIKGCVPNSVSTFNGVVACTYNELADIAKLFSDPNIGDVINSWMGDPQGAIARIIAYPFPFEIERTGTLGIGAAKYDDIAVSVPKFDANLNHHTIHRLCSIKITPKYKDFRDYNGYTTIRAYLPFYGFVDVPTNDVMDKYLIVFLAIDYRTGSGIYFVTVADNDFEDSASCRILSKHSCQIGVVIPTTGTNALEVGRNLILGAVRIGTSIAIGAGTGTLLGRATSTTTFNRESTTKISGKNPATNRMNQQRKFERSESGKSEHTTAYSYTKATLSDISNTAFSAIGNSVVHTSCDNTMYPAIEQFATKQVQVVIERPKFVSMGNYRKYMGSPLYQTRKLQDVYGYTEIGSIHLEHIKGITDNERNELEKLLLEGVIL